MTVNKVLVVPSPGQVEIFLEVATERRNQDAQWGGAEHDDAHDPSDWLRFVGKQLAMAHAARQDMDAVSYRERLVKIAALAVAGLESFDRTTPLTRP